MAFPTRLGQIAHLATQAWYLARHCWDHPVLADNRLWYQGRSASLYSLVRGESGSGPARLRLRLDEPALAPYREDIAIIYTLRIARPGDITRTRFDLLDFKSFECYEIKPDNARQLAAGKADLDDRLRMLNADSRAPIPASRRQELRLEGWKPKTWTAGKTWPATGIEVPLGIKTVARVRLVATHQGVLAWRRVKPRRRRRQRRITSVRQLRAYIASTLQTAPEVSVARLLVGMGEVVGAYAVGRVVLARAARATAPVVVRAEQEAARAILRRAAESARRATRGARPPKLPPPWQRLPGSGGPQLPGGAARGLAVPGGAGIAEGLRELASDESNAGGLLEDLATIGEAVEQFFELESAALDLLLDVALFPWTGIEENTALGFLHPEPFFQATRNLLVSERRPAPPTPPQRRPAGQGDAGSRRPAPVPVPRGSPGYPESGGTPATQEELELQGHVELIRPVAELIVAHAPYGAPLNTDPFYFQVEIWAELLAALVEAFGSADAVVELFGLAALDLDDPAGRAQLAEVIARDPAAITGWAILDWLLFEDETVFDDMLASTASDDFGPEQADDDG